MTWPCGRQLCNPCASAATFVDGKHYEAGYRPPVDYKAKYEALVSALHDLQTSFEAARESPSRKYSRNTHHDQRQTQV